MAEVASIYLPAGAAIFVTIGAIAAIMTALNGTIFVPSRLTIMFVEDGLAPRWLGFINKTTATPIRGLTLTMICCAILLVSGQLALALNVAVFALVVLYFIHSCIFVPPTAEPDPCKRDKDQPAASSAAGGGDFLACDGRDDRDSVASGRGRAENADAGERIDGKR